MEEREKVNIKELLRERKGKKFLNVVAPMVRYSRLEFRALTRKYGADLCFTPMTVANCFLRSDKARQADFSTNVHDTPVIMQFAANCTTDFLYATQMVVNYVDGVDLNCGCPQGWAKADGYGCYLLQKTEVIEDMMKTVRRNTPADFSVSIKIRLLNKDIRNTVDLAQKLENLGVSFISVHGRTPYEKSSSDFPVDADAISEIKKSLQIPVIFNGDVTSLSEAEKFYEITKCEGMMSAREILSNPALFADHKSTPLSCVQDWIDISHRQQDKMSFQTFHHHLTFMLESSQLVKKPDRIRFNDFSKKHQCFEFLEEKLSITPRVIDFPENTKCHFDDTSYRELTSSRDFWENGYSSESSHGKFFLGKMHKTKIAQNDDYLEFMDDCSSLFNI